MFKTTSTVHLENVSDAGLWNSFATIFKQQDNFKSAYVDKVRITFVQEDQLTTATGAVIPWLPVMFAAANSSTLSNTPSNNDQNIICAAGGRGGGTVTLNIKRRIVTNEVDEESGDGAIRLFIKASDPTQLSGDGQFYLIIETYGRWHRCDSL